MIFYTIIRLWLDDREPEVQFAQTTSAAVLKSLRDNVHPNSQGGYIPELGIIISKRMIKKLFT